MGFRPICWPSTSVKYMLSRYTCQWPELLEQLGVVEDRRLDLAVAARARSRSRHSSVSSFQIAIPFGQPERRAGRELGEHEQVELLAELAVVARAGLLEPLEVLVELVLGRERGAVDAGEHLAVGVAAPVGAGDAGELERLRAAGVGRVRAAAEVEEVAVRVEADRLDALVLDQVLDQLDLVRLVLAQVAVDRLAGGDLRALERLVGLDVLAHLRLDLREVVLVDRDAVRELEVVVEAVGDRRADRDLRARVELEHGLGEHVRDVVAQQLQRVAVARPWR